MSKGRSCVKTRDSDYFNFLLILIVYCWLIVHEIFYVVCFFISEIISPFSFSLSQFLLFFMSSDFCFDFFRVVLNQFYIFGFGEEWYFWEWMLWVDFFGCIFSDQDIFFKLKMTPLELSTYYFTSPMFKLFFYTELFTEPRKFCSIKWRSKFMKYDYYFMLG